VWCNACVEDQRGGARPEAGWRREAALHVMRAAWLAITVGLTTLVAVGFVRAFRDPELVALTPLTALFVAAGLDFRLMIAVALLTPFVTVVAICALVFARRSHDPMALLFTLTLLAFYSFGSRTLLTYDASRRITSIKRVTSAETCADAAGTGPTTTFLYGSPNCTPDGSIDVGAVFCTVVRDPRNFATTYHLDSELRA
jgi:hypothetical protein